MSIWGNRGWIKMAEENNGNGEDKAEQEILEDEKKRREKNQIGNKKRVFGV